MFSTSIRIMFLLLEILSGDAWHHHIAPCHTPDLHHAARNRLAFIRQCFNWISIGFQSKFHGAEFQESVCTTLTAVTSQSSKRVLCGFVDWPEPQLCASENAARSESVQSSKLWCITKNGSASFPGHKPGCLTGASSSLFHSLASDFNWDDSITNFALTGMRLQDLSIFSWA